MSDFSALRRGARSVARAALAPLPLQFWEGVFPKDAIALCYHMISDERLAHCRLYPHKNTQQFESDVLFAKDRAVTYRRLVEHRLFGAPLPRNSLLFTFDDGFAECYDTVRPILLQHGVDGVFFVTTNLLDDRAAFLECTLSQCLTAAELLPRDRVDALLCSAGIDGDKLLRDRLRYSRALRRAASAVIAPADSTARRTLYLWLLGLDEGDDDTLAAACTLLDVDVRAYSKRRPIFLSHSQVKQLAADGFTVGAHGRSHHLLEKRDPEFIEAEIVASCSVVRELTGQERVPFAFPHSGVTIERRVIEEIRRRNPLVDLIFDSGSLRRDPNFIVNRVFTDAPAGAASTNVPAALRDSWSIPSAWYRSARPSR